MASKNFWEFSESTGNVLIGHFLWFRNFWLYYDQVHTHLWAGEPETARSAPCFNKIINKQFYYDYEKEIILKSENLRENKPKIDKEIVRKLYFDEGLKQIEIVKKLNSKKSTINGIIKKLKI